MHIFPQIWCRRVTALYENVNILDMDQSWRDGIAFCALIDHFRPGLLGRSVQSLDSGDILDNNSLAFRVAEEELGIPSLLDPQVRNAEILSCDRFMFCETACLTHN